MLTNRELAQLRADILITLPDTCTIQRNTPTVDSYGYTTEVWASVATGVQCRVDPASKQGMGSGVVAEREAARTYFQLTVPYDTTIADADRVVYGGTTFEIIQLHEVHSLRAVRRAVIARIDG